MEIPLWMPLIILWMFMVFYIGLIIYVWRKKHPRRLLITFLMLLGPVGIAISVFILVRGWENKRWEKEYLMTVEPKLGDVGVYQCSNCGTPYRLQDYRPDATIVCSACKKNITRPTVI